MRLRFLWIGKTKNEPIRSLIEDYLQRIRHWVPCDVIETRNLARKRSLKSDVLIVAEAEELKKHLGESTRLVALDEKGTQYTSSAFSRWLQSEMNRGSRSITFVIGGPEGLSSGISEGADMVLSMGKMTWTHEMCRVLLLEQIYRVLCILHGIPYHKA
jgi:23S rRNA (pseudouridine1915-N3)-methyltransferase